MRSVPLRRGVSFVAALVARGALVRSQLAFGLLSNIPQREVVTTRRELRTRVTKYLGRDGWIAWLDVAAVPRRLGRPPDCHARDCQ